MEGSEVEVNEKKKYFIMDGNAYVYRAYYAIEELSTSTGIPTNAVFGFTRLLLSILLDDKPDYLAIAFDTAGPTFRHEEYEIGRASCRERV